MQSQKHGENDGENSRDSFAKTITAITAKRLDAGQDWGLKALGTCCHIDRKMAREEIALLDTVFGKGDVFVSQ